VVLKHYLLPLQNRKQRKNVATPVKILLKKSKKYSLKHMRFFLKTALLLSSFSIIHAQETEPTAIDSVEKHHETEEVVVTATRSERKIDDVPIRVEAVPQEEIEEKILMRASSVSMLLSELIGMRLQTTSAASNTANVRIQGLNGRYTQILMDGVPNFSGMSSGFSIVQLPPLNLRQVEVVKGTSSVLYGADAIAGVVNFITKRPSEKQEISAFINQSTLGASDVSAYYGHKPLKDFGYTFLANYNYQKKFDADGDDFTDLAGYNRYSIFPKFTYDFSKDFIATLNLGFTGEERDGGSISGIDNSYTEENKSTRINAGIRTDWIISASSVFTLNAAGMQMVRDADYGDYLFNATQRILYSDAQYNTTFDVAGKHNLLFGAAFTLDDVEDRTQIQDMRDPVSYKFSDIGIFAQEEYNFAEGWTALLAGRVDFHNEYGTFFSPRASLMYKPIHEITMRVSGGQGFKASTVFIEEAEEVGFKRLFRQPLNAETARNGQFDINWRTELGEFAVNLNALGFATIIDNAVYAHTHEDNGPELAIIHVHNATGPTFTRGGEISGNIGYDDFKFILGYTYVYATQENLDETRELELNPRHAANFIIMYENHELGIKAGLENFYTGTQRLDSNANFGEVSKPYLITGALIEKALGNFRVYVNFENIFDTRQTRFQPTNINESRTGFYRPLPIWAPLEGRAINGGIRYVL
jgi:iron complex outermembrane receptor protein